MVIGLGPLELVLVMVMWVLPVALLFLVGYWVVRKAVCAGILDAERRRASDARNEDAPPRTS